MTASQTLPNRWRYYKPSTQKAILKSRQYQKIYGYYPIHESSKATSSWSANMLAQVSKPEVRRYFYRSWHSYNSRAQRFLARYLRNADQRDTPKQKPLMKTNEDILIESLVKPLRISTIIAEASQNPNIKHCLRNIVPLRQMTESPAVGVKRDGTIVYRSDYANMDREERKAFVKEMVKATFFKGRDLPNKARMSFKKTNKFGSDGDPRSIRHGVGNPVELSPTLKRIHPQDWDGSYH